MTISYPVCGWYDNLFLLPEKQSPFSLIGFIKHDSFSFPVLRVRRGFSFNLIPIIGTELCNRRRWCSRRDWGKWCMDWISWKWTKGKPRVDKYLIFGSANKLSNVRVGRWMFRYLKSNKSRSSIFMSMAIVVLDFKMQLISHCLRNQKLSELASLKNERILKTLQTLISYHCS